MPEKPSSSGGRRPLRRKIAELCGEIGGQDGLDPKLEARAWARVGEDRGGGGRRKTFQLCAQVSEALAAVLAEQPHDLLRDLEVLGVEPAPDASRLLVTLRNHGPADVADAMAAVEASAGRLRTAVASAITRRKAPNLAFRFRLDPDTLGGT